MNEELAQEKTKEEEPRKEEEKIQPFYYSIDIIKGFIFSELILPPVSVRRKK
jgi:hypothetical protein